jgi:hypothetical protein
MTTNGMATYTPAVGDIVTITPQGMICFEVLALDEIDGTMVYVAHTDPNARVAAQWVFLTHVRPVEGAMTRAQLIAWFSLRGLPDGGYRDELLEQHLGDAEAEMDALYESMHP